MYVLLAATLPGSAIGSVMYPFRGTKGKKGTYRGTEAFSTTRQRFERWWRWCCRIPTGVEDAFAYSVAVCHHYSHHSADSQFFKLVASNYGRPLFPRCASFTYHAFGNRDATLLLFCGGRENSSEGGKI